MIVSNNNHSQNQPTLTTVDVGNRLTDLVCEKIKAICADNKRRLAGAKADPSLLDRGIYYPNEYREALQEAGRTEAIDALAKQNAFVFGFTASKHFQLVDTATRTNGLGKFQLTKDARPSTGLKEMAEGLTLMECRGICDLVRYWAIAEVLGEEKFDALFCAASRTPLTIGFSIWTDPLNFLLHWIKEYPLSGDPIQLADLFYFENLTDYLQIHPEGIACGYNTFCIDNGASPKFTGLGLPGDGLEKENIHKALWEEYNKPVGSNRITWDRFKKKTIFCGQLCSRLHAERITALANAKIEEAKALMVAYWTSSNK